MRQKAAGLKMEQGWFTRMFTAEELNKRSGCPAKMSGAFDGQ